MSFVIGKSPKVSIFAKAHDLPGPADYQPQNHPCSEQPAPFNASSLKVSTFDVEVVNCGPGSYNPIYSKEIQKEKKLRMSSSFNSKVQRFQNKNDDSKIVQQRMHVTTTNTKKQYQEQMQKTKEKLQDLQENNKKRKVQSIKVNKEYVRIVLSNPKNTEMLQSVYVEKQLQKKQNGPGGYFYDLNRMYSAKNVVDWSKNNQKRFKSKKSNNPGPGSYTLENKHERDKYRVSSSFAFEGVRSHMDELIYKTKMPLKIEIIEKKHLKDRFPGPGQYSPRLIANKSFHCGLDHFGSAIPEERYQQESIAPGPGTYNFSQNYLHEKSRKTVKNARQKIFGKPKIKKETVITLEQTNKEEVIKQCKKSIEKNNFYSLEQRCRSKYGSLNQQERFKQFQSTRKMMPGPGEYKIAQTLNEKEIKSIFNSTTNRANLTNQCNVNLPFYEIGRQDIGRKALKIRRNIENLKQIDMIKAPFNCNEKRFDSSEGSDKEKTIDFHRQNYSLDQQSEPRRTKYEKRERIQPSAVFKSNTKRQKMEGANEIGPGQYNYEMSRLDKKSFNLQYNYEAPLKIRPSHGLRVHSSLA